MWTCLSVSLSSPDLVCLNRLSSPTFAAYKLLTTDPVSQIHWMSGLSGVLCLTFLRSLRLNFHGFMLSQNVSEYFMLSHYLPWQSRRSCSGTQKLLRTTHKRNESKHLSSSRAAQHFLQFDERLVIKNCVSRYTSQTNRSLFHSSMRRFAITSRKNDSPGSNFRTISHPILQSIRKFFTCFGILSSLHQTHNQHHYFSTTFSFLHPFRLRIPSIRHRCP